MISVYIERQLHHLPLSQALIDRDSGLSCYLLIDKLELTSVGIHQAILIMVAYHYFSILYFCPFFVGKDLLEIPQKILLKLLRDMDLQEDHSQLHCTGLLEYILAIVAKNLIVL
jgi:hypothetical protein